MTRSSLPSSSSPRSVPAEVLEEYMQRLDRGEPVDRELFLARHSEWAEELRSYFAGSDEVGRIGRRAEGEKPALPPMCALPESGRVGEAPPAEAKARRVGDYELLGQIGQGAMGLIYKAHH